jgi:hypothetical protein
MAKKLTLQSIKDIIENVNEENAERFLNDFIVFLAYSIEVKKSNLKVSITSMVWKDDSKHELVGYTYNGKYHKLK